MKKVAIIAICAVLICGAWVKYCARADNGVFGIGQNIALIEGECIVINWNATETEIEAGLHRWMELKRG